MFSLRLLTLAILVASISFGYTIANATASQAYVFCDPTCVGNPKCPATCATAPVCSGKGVTCDVVAPLSGNCCLPLGWSCTNSRQCYGRCAGFSLPCSCGVVAHCQ